MRAQGPPAGCPPGVTPAQGGVKAQLRPGCRERAVAQHPEGAPTALPSQPAPSPPRLPQSRPQQGAAAMDDALGGHPSAWGSGTLGLRGHRPSLSQPEAQRRPLDQTPSHGEEEPETEPSGRSRCPELGIHRYFSDTGMTLTPHGGDADLRRSRPERAPRPGWLGSAHTVCSDRTGPGESCDARRTRASAPAVPGPARLVSIPRPWGRRPFDQIQAVRRRQHPRGQSSSTTGT